MPTKDATAPTVTIQRAVWVSSSNIGHVDLQCSGLDRMREAGRDPAEYLDPHTYARRLIEVFNPVDGPHEVRPCRICALEPVLIEMFRDTPIRQPGTVFVITGLGGKTLGTLRNRRSPITDDERERVAQLRAAANQRLHRVASAAGLTTTVTAAGAVIYGNLPVDVAEMLNERVETFTFDEAQTPTEEVVRVFVSLIRSSGVDKQQAWITAHDIAS